MNNTSNQQASRPFDWLSESINKNVLVELKGNLQFRGVLKAFDVHMNIVLESAESLDNGEPKTKYGKVVLRGDNILLISP
ncbi:MAG: LSM domain-containing protein [archaeon]